MVSSVGGATGAIAPGNGRSGLREDPTICSSLSAEARTDEVVLSGRRGEGMRDGGS